MKHFLDVTTTTSTRECLNTLSNQSLIIYSPTSLRYVDAVPHKGIPISTHATGKDTTKLEKLCTEQYADVVVGIGGGTAIDIAKYIASRTGCEFICIPTMLSTNAFATNKASLVKGGSKVTLDAKLADKIVLDIDLIAKAGAYNLYGLCDILSIHTALYDWHLADKAGSEKINPAIYKKAHELLGNALQFSIELSGPDRLDIPFLFSMIGESGHITNLYGSGRPESGSEHIFAKELESRVKVPHGISTAIGITLMSQLQGHYSADVQAALRQIGVMADIAYEYNLRHTVRLSLENISPRRDRYTILNETLPTIAGSRYLTDMLYTETLGVENEHSHY